MRLGHLVKNDPSSSCFHLFSLVSSIQTASRLKHQNAQTLRRKGNNRLAPETFFCASGKDASCKSYIENALKVKGLNKLTWDAEAQLLTVVFDPKVIRPESLKALAAEAGCDISSVKAGKET